MIYCEINLDTPVPSTYTREIWDFSNAIFSELNEELSQAPFDISYTLFDDIDDVAHYWFTLLKSVISDFIPHKTVKIRSKDKPWVTSELRYLMRKRSRLWKRFRRTKNPHHYEIYRNQVVNLNRKNRLNFASDIDLCLNGCSDLKTWWKIKLSRLLLRSKSNPNIPPLLHDGVLISNDRGKAELLNDYFSQQCSLPDHANSIVLPPFQLETDAHLESVHITEGDLLNVLNALHQTKLLVQMALEILFSSQYLKAYFSLYVNFSITL